MPCVEGDQIVKLRQALLPKAITASITDEYINIKFDS